MIPKETQTEIKLYDWLINNGIEVYFNRKIKILNNKYKFTTNNLEKPDLILYSNKINKYIAIEVKTGTNKRDIYESHKIISYQQDYKNKKTEYFIDGKIIKISYFLIATENSKQGKIFNEEEIVYPDDERFHKILQKTHQEPKKEYKQTKSFLRFIWSIWRNKKIYGRLANDPAIGILTSSILDDDEKYLPKMQIIEYSNIKNKWVVKWLEI